MTLPRIGINLLWLIPDQAGGAEEYAVRSLRSLADEASEIAEFTILCNRGFPVAHPDLVTAFETAVAPTDGMSRLARVAIESTWLATESVRRNLHLVHHLNNLIPLVRSRPSVLTIHDLRPVLMPDTLGAAHGAYLRARFGPSAERARVIATPSAYVRGTVLDVFGLDPDRVLVVSAPVIAPDPPYAEVEAGIGAPFFLYPAITNPHKNHRTLLEAFSRVRQARPGVALVLTGATGPAEDNIRASIRRLSLEASVHRLGRVPAMRLNALFREAVSLAYPSHYEGFGLPLAEAMAAGCPVIASNATALPEVVGGAGLLVEPDDVEGWAAAMTRMLDDDELRQDCIAAGHERVRSFTTLATARSLMAAYRMAL